MKKQFYKVKHFADQTFSRAGKTEVLTDDLQSANKHVEHINNIVAGLNKRFGNPPNINDPAVKEKRIKKCPEFLLGNTMLENVIDDGKGLISYTLNECGKAEIALANEIIDHESKIEQLVSLPIHQLLETDIPNIHKLKKELRMLIGNVENLKSRYHQASKHGTTGTNSTKAGNIKDELDSAESKVELCQDHLAAEMFQLMSKEAVLAQTIFQYVKLQRAYHESALHCLKDVIPQLERYINDNQMKPVYGCPLEKHLQLTNRKIALPIQICVSALLRVGMDEQGLFRIASGAAKLRRIKMSFDAWCISFPIALEYDPHTLAGALKSYLRELPEPILTYRLYSEWMSIAKVSQISERQRLINELLQKLPASNFDNLKFLIKFLAILSKNENNKMTCQNLGIIIAPNLLWSPQEDTTSIVMDTANNSSLIVEQLITNANYYFPGDIDFDEDLETGIVNGSETSSGGLRRCVSSSSLSDPAESPSQGSPKPATRRKNKPAPTPPSGNTPDKHDKRPDDKPPPAPDKPPRPLSTATLNRSSYKAAKNNKSQDLSNINPERKHLNKSFDNLSTENETQPSNFFLLKEESSNNTVQKNVNESSNEDLLNTKIENEKEKVTEEIKLNPFIGFEGYSAKLPNKPNESENLNNASQTPNKLVPNEKSSPIILERRKVPIATPRNLSNLASNIHGDETVELRRKVDSNSSVNVDRSSKPAIPERPAGLMRPSSLIRPQPRSTNENLVSDSGPLDKANLVEKKKVCKQQKQGNSNPAFNLSDEIIENSSYLQRSPSVGSRPTSMSVSIDQSAKPPRPELPDSIKSHARTRSEGNIIDVQIPSDTSSEPKSPTQQPQPISPRFFTHQRPPRPIPPPPPPPTVIRPKSEESTNL